MWLLFFVAIFFPSPTMESFWGVDREDSIGLLLILIRWWGFFWFTHVSLYLGRWFAVVRLIIFPTSRCCSLTGPFFLAVLLPSMLQELSLSLLLLRLMCVASLNQRVYQWESRSIKVTSFHMERCSVSLACSEAVFGYEQAVCLCHALYPFLHRFPCFPHMQFVATVEFYRRHRLIGSRWF